MRREYSARLSVVEASRASMAFPTTVDQPTN